MKNYSTRRTTQRQLWENLRNLWDVSEETSLINLPGDISEICKSALFEMFLRHVWNVSKMHLRCIHAGWEHVKCIPLSNYHISSGDFYLTLFKINSFLWWHFDINSVLLFNRTFGSTRAIIIFSVRQKSHFLVQHLYQDADTFILRFRW